MSRTRKTRPLMVKAADPTDHTVGLEEVHDHDDGVCNLPERPPRKLEHVTEIMYRPGQCYYTWEYKGVGLCGCRMCTAHDEFKADRRKARHEAKRELKQRTKAGVSADE